MTQSGHRALRVCLNKLDFYMDLDTPNRWLTLSANLAVLVGIILLIVELDQNRDMMRAQTRNEIARATQELLTSWATNPELADIVVRANRNEDLSPSEYYMVAVRNESMLRHLENLHYQNRQGLYDRSEFEASSVRFSQLLRGQPSLLRHWCATRSGFLNSFNHCYRLIIASLSPLLAVSCRSTLR
jgi:hypothetical protein